VRRCAGHDRSQCSLKNLSGGIETEISRGFGCTKCASA
jgi:hypothetical protein